MADAALLGIVTPTLIIQQQQQQMYEASQSTSFVYDEQRQECIRRRMAELESKLERRRALPESAVNTREIERLQADLESLQRALTSNEHSPAVDRALASTSKHKNKSATTKSSKATPTVVPDTHTRLMRAALKVADDLHDEPLRLAINAVPVVDLGRDGVDKVPVSTGSSYIQRWNSIVKQAVETIEGDDLDSQYDECVELARAARRRARPELDALRQRMRDAAVRESDGNTAFERLNRDRHDLILARRRLEISLQTGRAGTDIVQSRIDELANRITSFDERIVRVNRERATAARDFAAARAEINRRSLLLLRAERKLIEECERRIEQAARSELAAIQSLDDFEVALTATVETYYSASEEEEEEAE